tara:strand:- start:39 stop:293 length:255 start_codon:yes stop_codon:yes gene_type:complete
MARRDNFFIIIKYHYNPTTNGEKKKPLPVLMLDGKGDPLEFDSQDSADEFVDICNINSNQGFHYDVKEIGKKYLKVSAKQLLKD